MITSKYPPTKYIYASQYQLGKNWRVANKHLLFSFALSEAKRFPNWRVVRILDNVTLAAKYVAQETCDE